jgi:hypothetical protein
VAPAAATARVPGPSSPALLPARALQRPLADKRVYRPRCFHFPAARARPGAAPSPPGVASLGRLHNVALCKPAGGIKARASSASCLKACHCACALRARAFAVLDGAAVLNPRARHARARPGERAGHEGTARPPAARASAQRANLRCSSPLPGRGANRAARGIEHRTKEERRCRARSDARSVTRRQKPAPKARTKLLRGLSRAHAPQGRHRRQAPARASWCALPRAPSAHSARVM